MIDFRYHLVSIVAVFLALAIGIVVGSTALQPTVLSGLQKTSTAERKQIDSLIAQNDQLNQQRNAGESFAAASEGLLLSGLLEGQHVVIIQAPGAPGGVTAGVTNAVQRAGAVLSGQVQMQQPFFSTGTRAGLDTLNRQLTPVNVTLRAGSAQAQAGELIASALLTRDPAVQLPTTVTDSEAKTILNGYAAGGFLSVSAPITARATLAIVIIPAAPPSTDDTNPQSQTLVTLAQQLNQAGEGTVVAGQTGGSGPGSAIDVMRTGGNASHLSSVDNADTTTGQIVVAQSLYEELITGQSGSYGSLPTASSAGPSPAPSPSPAVTPTSTPTPTATKRGGR